MPSSAESGLTADAVAAARQASLRQLNDRTNELNNQIRRAKDQLRAVYERQQMFVPTEYLENEADEDVTEIAQLEAEIKAQEREIWEATCTNKTYELIVKRLRDEGHVYSRELGLIDHHAKVKEHDATELTLMVKDACDVRDSARAELAKATEKKEAQLRQYEAKLHERRRKVKLRQGAAEAHAARCEERIQRLQEQREAAMERRLMSVKLGSLEAEREEIAQIHQMFQTIKETVGVSHPDDVIDKFNAQGRTHDLLCSLISESQERIDKLRQVRASEERRRNQARFQARSSDVLEGAEGSCVERPASAASDVSRHGRVAEQGDGRLPSELEQKAAARAHAEQIERQRLARGRKATALIVGVGTAIAQLKSLMEAGEAVGQDLVCEQATEEKPPALDLVSGLTQVCERMRSLSEAVIATEAEREIEGRLQIDRVRRKSEIAAAASAALGKACVNRPASQLGIEVAEVAALAEDVESHRLPGPLIMPGPSNYRLQEEGEYESSGEEAEQEEEAVLDREALKKQARLVLKRQTKSTRRAQNIAKPIVSEDD